MNGRAEIFTQPQAVCLAIDASNRWISVALSRGDGSLALSSSREGPRDSFRDLVPTIQQLLDQGQVERPDWIATTRGPGSFTGLRISVGAARNLAQLWDVPVRSVVSPLFYLFAIGRSLETAGTHTAQQELAVMIDGKQGRVYASRATITRALAGECDTPLDLGPHEFLRTVPASALVFVDDAESIAGYLQTAAEKFQQDRQHWHELQPPDALELAQLCRTGRNVRTGTWLDLLPEYLREDPATAKFPGGF